MMQTDHLYNRIIIPIYVSILLGLSPVTVLIQNDQIKLTTSRKLKVINYTYIIIYLLLIFSMFLEHTKIEEVQQISNKPFQAAVAVTYMGRSTAFIIVHWCYTLSNKRMKHALEELAGIDMCLQNLGIKPNRKIELFLQLIYLFLPVPFVTVTLLSYWISPKDHASNAELLSLIIGILTDIAVPWAGMQFLLLALTIRRNFYSINYCLEHFNENWANEKENLQKIKFLMYLHDRSCDTAKMINFSWGLVIISSFTYSLGSVIINCFYASSAYIGNKPNEVFLALNAAGLQCLVGFSLTIVGEKVHDEGRKTKVIVHKLLLRIRSKILTKELTIFSRQLLYVNLHFSITGLCPLDVTSLCWTLGFVPSILIVMWQGHLLLIPRNCKTSTNTTKP